MSDTNIQHTVRTPDGRTLAVEEAGDPDGRPVLVAMGTPNSRRLYAPHTIDAAVRRLRLICYDRPGYGGSTPDPGRNVASCVADVRAICADLGITRLAMWGISGGGPHVLACAALLPDLVVAAASLASLAPADAEDLDFVAGMGQLNVDDFKLLQSDPAAARTKLDAERTEMLSASPAEEAKMLETLLSPVDAAVLTGGLGEYLAYTAHEGLAPGNEGWWDDGIAQSSPWGFSPSDITIPVMVMHGRRDQFVPFSHGEWLAAHVPNAQARFYDQDGHLTLMANRIGEVHAWLAEHF